LLKSLKTADKTMRSTFVGSERGPPRKKVENHLFLLCLTESEMHFQTCFTVFSCFFHGYCKCAYYDKQCFMWRHA